jgi:FkbH-like protein
MFRPNTTDKRCVKFKPTLQTVDFMLEFPKKPEEILLKKRNILRHLNTEASNSILISKKIAILGGSTTSEFKDILELYLIKAGIRPEFYESGYNKYYEDSVFGNTELDTFSPDLVFIYTSVGNIQYWPQISSSRQEVDDLVEKEFAKLRHCWEAISAHHGCPIIQNNFEFPPYRFFGNLDSTDHRGRVSFVNSLNAKLVAAAQTLSQLHIHDLCFDAACFGLHHWHDRSSWHAYKLAFAMEAIPLVASNLAIQMNALWGRSRKCLVVDLDNTLWGGVIGDEGIEGIKLGPEEPEGAAHLELQQYAKLLQTRGVLLAVCSKNEIENALSGLGHSESVLRPDSFAALVANWNPKSDNISQIAKSLNIGLDSLVFLDDNPAEQEIVRRNLPQVAVAPVGDRVETYISVIDRAGYFEVTSVTEEDQNRSAMYRENSVRKNLSASFENYAEYLVSLDMKAKIGPFRPEHYDRLHQLINKTNQFNLTTKRCSREEVENWSTSQSKITLYGYLTDRFGDSGLVSIVTADTRGDEAIVDIWLMSCRVLKRGLEYAMMNALVDACLAKRVTRLHATYIKSLKNKMVQGLLEELGFAAKHQDYHGNSEWVLELDTPYASRQHYIKVENT